MADRLDTAAFVDALLDAAPDAERDVVAMHILGCAASRLALMVGGRAAAGALYGMADAAATAHIAEDVRRG